MARCCHWKLFRRDGVPLEQVANLYLGLASHKRPSLALPPTFKGVDSAPLPHHHPPSSKPSAAFVALHFHLFLRRNAGTLGPFMNLGAVGHKCLPGGSDLVKGGVVYI